MAPAKLRRDVAYESSSEDGVVRVLERSSRVTYFQEQLHRLLVYLILRHTLNPTTSGPGHNGDDAANTKPVSATTAAAAVAAYRQSTAAFTPLPMEAIQSLFCDLELVEPGLVPVTDWWPTGPNLRPLPRHVRHSIGGLGRKP